MNPIFIFHSHPGYYSPKSGLLPLIPKVGATPVLFNPLAQRLEKCSWTLGHCVRRAGRAWFGSTWNVLTPVVDELKIAASLPRNSPSVAHFLFAEFVGIRSSRPLHRRRASVVGTFHASAVRQPTVMAGIRDFRIYDWISVVSAVQIPFFVARGFPAERIRVTPHGVVSSFFCPDGRARKTDGPIEGLLMGSTERDHEFMASVMRALPPGTLRLRVRTDRVNEAFYSGVPGVHLLPSLDDDALLEAYRSADLLVMPMADCTANNAILEAMACGTPVIANRIGGIPEYVNASAGYLTAERKDVEEWAALIANISAHREELAARRRAVRMWAEKFDWDQIAPLFRTLYSDALAAPHLT